jgi:hypothetical protein
MRRLIGLLVLLPALLAAAPAAAAQSVFCGAGEDSAWVDADDTPRGCERVLRPRR